LPATFRAPPSPSGQAAFVADPPPPGGHGVVAELAQGIAPQKPPGREQQALAQPVDGQRLHGVLAAGGDEAAVVAQQRADPPLVPPQQRDEQPGHWGFCRSGRPALANSLASVLLSWVLLRRGVWARATSIISYPPQFGERCSRSASRMTRRARLRCTAWPTFLVAVRPTRVTPARFLATYSTTWGCT